MVRRRHLPVAIEAPACTLETVAQIDPDWLTAFRTLVTEGPAELIGSGYAQIIGPLVPSEVVRVNLATGHRVYERLLGIRPSIAFVNEQTWSASLARHYREAGFGAAIMEWENPRATHPEWPAEWQYHPQRACGQDATTLPLLWSHTIAFQKLQRLAHGEIEINEYLAYIGSHRGVADRTLAIYASDAEIFDYRPGRYPRNRRCPQTASGTESRLHSRGWPASRASHSSHRVPCSGASITRARATRSTWRRPKNPHQ